MASNNSAVLYSYWRSTSSWRVRIVLAMKGVEYEYKPVNLLQGEQLRDDYAAINPLKEVPTLIINGNTISQSVAIMEYLEETHSNPPLLPSDPYHRAKVRQIVECVVSDIQPIQNLRVLKKVGEEKKSEWAKFWIDVGFQGLEKLLQSTSGKYCWGDTVTLADCVLVPQVYNALRFSVDMTQFPCISRINDELSKLDAFKRAHPSVQPDAVAS